MWGLLRLAPKKPIQTSTPVNNYYLDPGFEFVYESQVPRIELNYANRLPK